MCFTQCLSVLFFNAVDSYPYYFLVDPLCLVVPSNSRSSFSQVGETNAEHMALHYLERWITTEEELKLDGFGRLILGNSVDWTNSVDHSSVNPIRQKLSATSPDDSATALGIDLTFLFWCWDDSRLSQLVSFAFFRLYVLTRIKLLKDYFVLF